MSDQTSPIYASSKEVSETTIGDEVILLHKGSGIYFGLDSTSAEVWADLKSHHSKEQIASRLAAAYDVDFATALADTEGFINDLLAQRVIEPIPKASVNGRP